MTLHKTLRPLLMALAITAPYLSSAAQVEQPMPVTVSGAVLNPQNVPWRDGLRLRDVAVAGQVRADAWFMGAALLRQSEREPQARLRAGVEFDLNTNRVHALSTGDTALAALLERLQQQVALMPVTGRVPAQMNPLQQMLLRNNPLVQPGDRLVYPLRPAQVRVMGAVNTDCELPFSPGYQPLDYLKACPRAPGADRSYLYVVQPDATVRHVGVAHWNAESANVAVGAVIYVPFSAARLSSDTPDLNDELARLLATQYRLGGRFNE